MTITIEFPLSGGNKFELFVSDPITASDFDRMREVIETARDSLVITTDMTEEMKAEANRGHAGPVEEDQNVEPDAATVEVRIPVAVLDDLVKRRMLGISLD